MTRYDRMDTQPKKEAEVSPELPLQFSRAELQTAQQKSSANPENPALVQARDLMVQRHEAMLLASEQAGPGESRSDFFVRHQDSLYQRAGRIDNPTGKALLNKRAAELGETDNYYSGVDRKAAAAVQEKGSAGPGVEEAKNDFDESLYLGAQKWLTERAVGEAESEQPERPKEQAEDIAYILYARRAEGLRAIAAATPEDVSDLDRREVLDARAGNMMVEVAALITRYESRLATGDAAMNPDEVKDTEKKLEVLKEIRDRAAERLYPPVVPDLSLRTARTKAARELRVVNSKRFSQVQGIGEIDMLVAYLNDPSKDQAAVSPRTIIEDVTRIARTALYRDSVLLVESPDEDVSERMKQQAAFSGEVMRILHPLIIALEREGAATEKPQATVEVARLAQSVQDRAVPRPTPVAEPAPQVNAEKQELSDALSAKIEDFTNPDEFYRVVVGDEAFLDIVNSGQVRTSGKKIQKEQWLNYFNSVGLLFLHLVEEKFRYSTLKKIPIITLLLRRMNPLNHLLVVVMVKEQQCFLRTRMAITLLPWTELR